MINNSEDDTNAFLDALHKEEDQIILSPRATRIELLSKDLERAIQAFRNNETKITTNVCVWSFFGIGLIFGAFVFGHHLYKTNPISLLNLDNQDLTIRNVPNWIIWYFSAARFIIITSYFTLTFYVLNMVSMFIKMLQKNNHKIAILESFATMTESASDTRKQEVFERLLNIVTDPPDNLLNSNNTDFQKTIITDLLTKIPKQY